MNAHASNFSKFIYTWLLILIVWLAFTSSFDIYEVSAGLIISLIISIFSFKSFTTNGIASLTPLKIFYMGQYLVVFLIELVIANFHVARIVIRPKLIINPGIVEFESKLTSDFAKLLLANSITLTPGTLTVDVVDNRFYIHWLEVKSTDPKIAYKEIAKKFEDILLKIYG